MSGRVKRGANKTGPKQRFQLSFSIAIFWQNYVTQSTRQSIRVNARMDFAFFPLLHPTFKSMLTVSSKIIV